MGGSVCSFLVAEMFWESVAKIDNRRLLRDPIGQKLNMMEALEIKREVDVLSDRLGKAQDYL